MGLATIPESLWREERIRMPSALVEALRAELTARGLYAEACSLDPPDKELYGGAGAVETLSHFAQRFKTSAARVQFVTLDPSGTFGAHATNLRGYLFDGNVSILDLACGAGGGLLSLLCTMAELRLCTSSPHLPVEICVMAADCSADARAIHESLSDRLRPHLTQVGIRLRSEYTHWDVTDHFSTTALMDRWFATCPDCEEHLVFISAFSGFMAKNTEVVLEAIKDIVKRLHDKPFSVAWIEPISNDSRKVLPKVLSVMTRLFRGTTQESGPNEEFDYVHPFIEKVLRGRARVLPWENLAR